jgi:hypothetical protein
MNTITTGFVRKDVTDKFITLGPDHGGPVIAGWSPISAENADMLDLKEITSNVVKSLDVTKSELSTSYTYSDGNFGACELDYKPRIVSSSYKMGFLKQFQDTKNLYLFLYQDRREFWPEQDIEIIAKIIDDILK